MFLTYWNFARYLAERPIVYENVKNIDIENVIIGALQLFSALSEETFQEFYNSGNNKRFLTILHCLISGPSYCWSW